MLADQKKTAHNMAQCIRWWRRLAVEVLAVSAAKSGAAFKKLLSRRQLFNALQVWLITEAGLLGDEDRTPGRNRYFRLDNVLLPVPAAGRNIARQRKARQARHSDIVGAPNAGFKHASAPDGNSPGQAYLVHLARRRVASDAAQLHIDDFAGSDFNGLASVLGVVNRLIQADWSLHF